MCNSIHFLILVALIADSATAYSFQNAADKPLDRDNHHAILVGCSKYPNLDQEHQLHGPVNDVRITEELLRDKFGFKKSKIIKLVSGGITKPTAINIRKAFNELCERVESGDQVFIFLAGHGGQQPNLNPDNDREPDGLDEVFVPQDVNGWNKYDEVATRNVIIDDEFSVWIANLKGKGAFVFFVADTCHSGSLDRGWGQAEALCRERRLPKIYNNEVERSKQDEEQFFDDQAGAISLFAVPARSIETEETMPPINRQGDGVIHGRLSYAFNQVLRNSNQSLNYRELVQKIRWQYEKWGWSPKPFLSGQQLQREVLGKTTWPDRSKIIFERRENEMKVNAGLLDQLNNGSILEVFPSVGGSKQKSLGRVKITKAYPAESIVMVESSRPIESLPVNGRCEVVSRSLGDSKIPVTAISATETSRDTARLMETLRAIGELPNSLIEVVEDESVAELFVVANKDRIFVQQKFDRQNLHPRSNKGLEGLAFDSTLKDLLTARFVRMSRAINLVRLAQLPNLNLNDKLHIELQFERKRTRPESEYLPIKFDRKASVYNNETIKVQITNQSSIPVDITAVYVDSQFSISNAYLIQNAKENVRIGAGQTGFLEIEIYDSTIGLEHLVLIALAAQTPSPISLGDRLHQSRARSQADDESNVPTALKQILDSSLHGGDRAPNVGASDLRKFIIRRSSWTVKKGERPSNN